MTVDPRLPPETPLVADLPATVPFVGPEAQERARGQAFAARLGANESVFGPSPRAVAAMAEAARDAWMYGDPECFALRSALAARLGVRREAIVVGEGIDGLLGVLCRLYVGPGVSVVTSDGACPTFNYHVAGNGGRLVKVPYAGDREDLSGLAAAARAEGARIVYVANPDNPMGSWWPARDLEALMDALPEGCLLALDEAYGETAPPEALPPIDLDRRNLVRLRTFSKAMGLAGLRVGYAVGAPALIARFEKVRNHFGVGRVAQAGALAALEDTAHLALATAEIAASRAAISSIAEGRGLRPLPSAANFVAIDCGRDGAYAQAVLAGLLARGVFARMPGVAPLDRCIRVSCGRAADLERFSDALAGALAAAG